MASLLMPLATAVWLIENTRLTFKQIAKFCNLHEIEIQGIADGEIAVGIKGENPILNGQLTEDNIKICEKDQNKELSLAIKDNDLATKSKVKKVKYIPIVKRRDKPDAIAWIIKNYPEIQDSKIVKLLGTTKKTIESIRSKTHANIHSIEVKDPVILGLCSQIELDNLIAESHKIKEGQEN